MSSWYGEGVKHVPRYARAWFNTTAALAAVGLIATLVVWSFFAVLGVFLSVAVIGGGSSAAAWMDDGPIDWRRVLRVSAATGVAVLGTLGLGVMVGPVALLVLLVAAATSPQALTQLRRVLTRWSAGQPPATAPPAPHGSSSAHSGEVTQPPGRAVDAVSPAPESLEVRDLCRAWRASFDQLEHSRSPTERLEVVRARQAYLDTLERRNPDGLAAWLAAGACPAGDPSAYLLRKNDP